MKKYPYFHSSLPVISEKNIVDLAKVISSKIAGKIPFEGLENYIYDEVPAIYINSNILGFEVILQGYGGEKGYYLEVNSHPSNNELNDTDEIDIDITRYIASLLEGTPGIKIMYKEIKSEDYITIME
ncbi:hypothetical protein P4645_22570 [Lysinibacillus fusiformis]|uniref:hypothetical protein n=1 Tax=Lysinibacillus fusiformis TaxID=28031 RepID=UPI0000F3901E|nr:hypothetical protein [Lysinibacillus fusiformis]EAZ84157.1 hypothetical protein BB14905_10085 [Bacillus sp. B14905]MED4079000.1 hypothetical protein [Lysinibacillus fusiformis]